MLCAKNYYSRPVFHRVIQRVEFFSETGCNNNNVKHSVFSAVVFDSFRLETNCRPPCGIAAAVTDVRKRNGMRFLSCRIRQQRSPGVVGAVLKQTGTAQWPDL